MKKPLIKICGLRRKIDTDYVNEFDVSFAGFVFAKSKRQIDIETALEIKKALRDDIKTVGVFADMEASEVRRITDSVGLDVVQLHSDEDNAYCSLFKDKIVWKALHVKDGSVLEKADLYDVDGFLLDAYDKGMRGGTGKCINWELAAEFAKKHYTVLAGGISAENICEAASVVNPDVIDLSSSVETDGFKDYNKIKQLFEALKERN
ncbi:MAG: phosphoribosylanthranilate isomerase [Clostridiales bacterium]|nr:phosphoribosylanthranilate isomerase [Clostridiales bacterium]